MIGATNPDELRGRISLKLGLIDQAQAHFDTGLEWALRPDVRFWIDAGRCHQGLAEVAETRADHTLAMQHLDAAGVDVPRRGVEGGARS